MMYARRFKLNVVAFSKNMNNFAAARKFGISKSYRTTEKIDNLITTYPGWYAVGEGKAIGLSSKTTFWVGISWIPEGVIKVFNWAYLSLYVLGS